MSAAKGSSGRMWVTDEWGRQPTGMQNGKACFQTSACTPTVWEKDRQLTVGRWLVRDASAKLDVFIQIAGAAWDSSKGARRVGWCDCVAIMYEKMQTIRVSPQQPEKCWYYAYFKKDKEDQEHNRPNSLT